MNRTINELKQGLLKCANENEDRTYHTGQVIVSSICKSAKDTIEELEVQLTEAKDLICNLLQVVALGEGWKHNLDWRVKAEQFLNRLENEGI